ncbi:MAG: TonB-dependent receptor [Methylococcaceae bacterium]|nr:TonB-dependent receptor [Methylococcaceae bacterium]
MQNSIGKNKFLNLQLQCGRYRFKKAGKFSLAFYARLIIVALMVALSPTAFPENSQAIADLTDEPIENLLNMEVYSASKFTQKKSDAPTAVTVITSQDIKDYGYRTLSDIVQSVRGVYVNNDRNYNYVGTRGFSIPGDLNTRVLVLLDGYRLNDALYDQGPLGTEFPVDVDLIERVEYLPGAGSAIYGNNAFFGVINVITKSGKDYRGKGVEVSGKVASYGTDQERMSFGKKFDNGLEMLLSGTRYDSKGENRLFFPELSALGATTHGVFDNAERLFGKFSWQHFTLEAGYSKRNKGLTTGIYGTVFNDSRNQNSDQHTFFNLTYDNLIADHLEVYARAYHGRYDYPGTFIYDNPPVTVNQGEGLSRWWGTEIRFVSTHIDGHKIMFGGEYQDNYHLSNNFVDVAPADPGSLVSFNQSTSRYSFYLQDEITFNEKLILNAGIRYDNLSYASNAVNPRLALIYKPWENATFKLLYGSSFRAPSPNELYYRDPIQIPNPHLSPEKIKTYEGIIEYQPDRLLRLTAVGFHYEISNLIQLREIPNPIPGDDPINKFLNVGTNKAWGAEFEVEKLWDYGTRLRASYTWVNAYDSSNNRQLINSPSNLFKLNFSTPLFDHRLRVGVEAQYTDSRSGRGNTKTAGYPLFNLTLTGGDKLFKGPLSGLEISGSIYNLLDRRYDSVASDEFEQRFIPQNGRNLRLSLSYRF